MEITSVSNIQIYSTTVSKREDTEAVTTQNEPAITNQEIAESEIPEITGSESEEVEQTEAEKSDAGKGVIRNLINGHFKGVADVRLRINFNDQIVALEQAELAKAADSGLTALSETLNNEINAALGSEEIDEETSAALASALETFNNEITQLKTDSSQNGNLLSEIRSSFDNFVIAAKPVVEEPAASEPPVSDEAIVSVSEPEVTPETEELTDEIPIEDEPLFMIDQFLTDLIATFETELNLLETRLTNISILPEISEPQGNGRAFDKFMSIYNDMKSGISIEEPISQEGDIDISS